MNIQQPLVSIITVNFRQPHVTVALLESIVQNSYKKVEVILVDNGSLADFSVLFKKAYPSVKIIISAENLGFAGGNNVGIAKAAGDFLFFVNNDTILTDGLIEGLLSRFAKNPQIGVVSPKIRYYDKPDTIQYAGFTEIHAITGRNIAIGKNEIDNGQHDVAYSTAYAHGAAMMVSRKVIEKVGFMPEEFFLYYEELDWCAHIRRAGFSIWYEPEGLIYHKESASVGKMNALKTYYLTRNRLLFMRRNVKGWRLASFLTYFYAVTFPIKTISFLAKQDFTLFVTFCQASLNFKKGAH